MEEKTTWYHKLCAYTHAWIRYLSWGLEINCNILVRNYLYLKNYVTSEGAISHTILNFRQLFIARYQIHEVSFKLTIILSNRQ